LIIENISCIEQLSVEQNAISPAHQTKLAPIFLGYVMWLLPLRQSALPA
jgi:hypothetical protein